jgi:8-oxo-dGTP pyrophosphatase MutT (NUDIX family)
MLPKPWTTRSTRRVYENPWIKVREDIAAMPNGRETIYGVIECPPAVGVLPFLDDEHVVMVRQYRYVFGESDRWEMPTGGLKDGESLEEAARRELREEVGYEAAELMPVSTFYTSKSVMREVAHLFIGRGLTETEAVPDETEFMQIGVLRFDQVFEMVLTSEIRDAMTVLAVLHAARLRGR